MIERLLLDGIDLQGCRSTVPEAVEFSTLIDTNEAEAGLAGMNVAMTRAKIAVNATAGFGLPPAALVERVGFLEDLECAQGRILLPLKSYASPRLAEWNCALEDEMAKTGGKNSGVTPNVALDTATFRGPVHKSHHIGPVFPGKPQEFTSVHVCGFFTKKRLEPPAQVRALPGIEAIPASNVPVVPQCFKHRSYTGLRRPLPKPS
jgi:hypothetical protein